ncbi:MAG: hypothetical protein R3C01_09645 [Planctomycetaceae bacterium]
MDSIWRSSTLSASVYSEFGECYLARFGVLDELRISIDRLVERKSLSLPVSAFPFVDRLTLKVPDDCCFGEFIRLPVLNRFRYVWFAEPLIGDERLLLLIKSPIFVNVSEWNFEDWGDSADKKVRRDYGGVPTAHGAASLAEWNIMNSCRTLNMGVNEIGIDGIGALASSRNLGKLETLTCWDSEFGDEGLEVIGNAAGFPSLRSLGCGYNQLTAAGARSLFSGPVGRQLTSVALHSSDFGKGIGLPLDQLKESPLRHLHMNFCHLTADGFGELMASEAFPDLRSLSLKRNSISSGFGRVFDRSRPIRKIDAGGNGIDDTALAAALSQEGASSLEWIDLSNNELTDRGVRELAGCSRMAKLEVLHLTGNPISDEAGRALRESPHLRNLKLLYLSKKTISEEEQEQLRARFRDGLQLW